MLTSIGGFPNMGSCMLDDGKEVGAPTKVSGYNWSWDWNLCRLWTESDASSTIWVAF